MLALLALKKQYLHFEVSQKEENDQLCAPSGDAIRLVGPTPLQSERMGIHPEKRLRWSIELRGALQSGPARLGDRAAHVPTALRPGAKGGRAARRGGTREGNAPCTEGCGGVASKVWVGR